jgi:putative membrane protein
MQNLKRIASYLGLAVAVTALPVVAQSNSMGTGMSPDNSNGNSMGNMGKMSTSDKKFVRDAAQGGMAEVELGKLATEKASSDDVKKFGQRMVDDHTKANDQLKQVASREGVQLPEKLNAKDQMTKERLSKLSGAEFDRAYMSDMVKDHTKDVADFQRESNSGMDPAVKDFASKTLPTLQDHLREAKQIAPSTRASSKSTMNESK